MNRSTAIPRSPAGSTAGRSGHFDRSGRRGLLLLLGLGLAGSAAAQPARLILLANRLDPDSVAIARHYAEVRGVPRANLLSFPMPEEETITWPQFIASIWQPLQDELVRRRWIDALPVDIRDKVGRRGYAVSGHRIAALVLCRGVPLRIADDPALFAASAVTEVRREFRTNAGAVDSELALLAADGGYPINGFVRNPLFRRLHPTEFQLDRVVKVSRLDGPSPAEAMALVDRAVAAERDGLIGRAYVDNGGEYADGKAWLAEVARRIRALGYDLATVERHGDTMPPWARCDAPAVYFGWHVPDLNGPFSLPGFRFPPGAVAVHIHSFSARTMRSATESWAGPLVARGAAATLGNVDEPYLQCTHRPDLFFNALADGMDLADAAFYALPVLSWQAILIGDPLYRPFAVGLEGQLRRLDRLPPGLAGYVVLRQARLLEAAGKGEAAISAMKEELARRENLALGLALAERLRKEGRPDEAAEVVEKAIPPGALPADQWAVLHDAAEFLAGNGRGRRAVALYRRLFAMTELPNEARARWLVDGEQAAIRSGDAAQAGAWKRDLDATVGAMLKEK